MSKSKQQQAEEKANQQTVSAQIPDKGKYPPGTIGSNKVLARKEALNELQRLGPDLPQVLEYGFYVCNAFCYASFLAVEGRQPLLNTRAGFIGDYVRLVVNFECAEEIRVLNSGTPFLEKWPKNPEKFGPDASWSALDVACKFSKRILDAVLLARTMALGVEVHNQLDYLSINDTRIDKWIEVFHKGCHGEFLPPQAQWPTWQIKTDADFLIRKLDNEYDSAKQALTSKQPTVASGKAETEKREKKAIILTEKQLKILKYLKEIKTAVAQVDIEVGTGISKNTISKELKILKGYDFVSHPKEKKRHVVITQKGIDYLNSLK